MKETDRDGELEELEELRALRDYYHRLFNNAREGVIILRDNTIVDANESAARLFGCTREELRGRFFGDFDPPYQQGGIPSQERLKEDHRIIREKGTYETEWLFIRKDGSEFLSDLSSTIIDGDTLFMQIRDITEQRKLESDLRLKSAQFKAILESIPFDFWINDLENRTFMQNQYSKTMWGNNLGKHIADIADSAELILKWANINQQAMDGKTVENEMQYHFSDGIHHFRNIVSPIRDGEELFGILGINIDITDYKQALEEREMLLREVHHRVKNNLQIISSMINLDPNRELFIDIENRINSMALIHEQLYNSDNFTMIEMGAYLERLSDSIRSSFHSLSADIQIELACEQISLDIERAIPLGIILNELITNSFKHAFSDGDGKLEISFCIHKDPGGDDLLQLKISDSGPGLPEDPGFERQEGLGLILIRQLSRQLQGSFSFDGSVGFRFCLSFPALSPSSRGAGGAEGSSGSKGAAKAEGPAD